MTVQRGYLLFPLVATDCTISQRIYKSLMENLHGLKSGVNNEDICVAEGDQDNNGSGDNTQAACSGVVDLVEGDSLNIFITTAKKLTAKRRYLHSINLVAFSEVLCKVHIVLAAQCPLN